MLLPSDELIFDSNSKKSCLRVNKTWAHETNAFCFHFILQSIPSFLGKSGCESVLLFEDKEEPFGSWLVSQTQTVCLEQGTATDGIFCYCQFFIYSSSPCKHILYPPASLGCLQKWTSGSGYSVWKYKFNKWRVWTRLVRGPSHIQLLLQGSRTLLYFSSETPEENEFSSCSHDRSGCRGCSVQRGGPSAYSEG